MRFLCPVDEVAFDTESRELPHHSTGHPDCPGPKCRAHHEVKLTKADRAELARKAAKAKEELAHKALLDFKTAQDAAKQAAKEAELPEPEDFGIAGETDGQQAATA